MMNFSLRDYIDLWLLRAGRFNGSRRCELRHDGRCGNHSLQIAPRDKVPKESAGILVRKADRAVRRDA